MRSGDLTVSVKRHFARHKVYALSFWSYPKMDAREIAAEVGRVAQERTMILGREVELMPHERMRHTTVGVLRAAGYEVSPGGGLRGHVTLVLDKLPTDTDWALLVDCFPSEEPNPIARKG